MDQCRKTSKKVLHSILEPLHAIEDVAKELTEGNLHSTLDYRSEDEIGRLAHSMRKSIRILGSYVDDIDRAMKLFSEGNFDVQPNVEWKGDFIGILRSFMDFEKSMAKMVKGIQRASNQVFRWQQNRCRRVNRVGGWSYESSSIRRRIDGNG